MLIGCNTIGHLSAGIFEVSRTGDDTSGKEWDRVRKMGVNTLAFRMPQHGAFFAVDADCVGQTAANSIPWEKNRQWLDLLAHSGTPLFVSFKRGSVTPEQERASRSPWPSPASQCRPANRWTGSTPCCPGAGNWPAARASSTGPIRIRRCLG